MNKYLVIKKDQRFGIRVVDMAEDTNNDIITIMVNGIKCLLYWEGKEESYMFVVKDEQDAKNYIVPPVIKFAPKELFFDTLQDAEKEIEKINIREKVPIRTVVRF